MKKTKYSEGYIPKIQYWTDKLIKAGTPIEQAAALSKINYFKKRHQQKYGTVVSIAELIKPDVRERARKK